MSTLLREFKLAVLDEDRWLKIAVVAIMLLLPAVGTLRLWFPETEAEQHPWSEWHAVTAHYEPGLHAIVVDSRSWTTHETCPPDTEMARNAMVIGVNRMVYMFETAKIVPVINQLGQHVTGQPIVIPLVDVDGSRLDMVPERMRLVVTCGMRLPAWSEDIIFSEPRP